MEEDSPDRITYDDVVWYVYKRQALNTHIDGYVSAHITYIANGGGTTPDGKTTVLTDKKMLGSTVSVRDNMFTVSGNNRFRGWNTKADGTGEWYYPEAPEFALNRNLTLYAQWGVDKDFTVNFYYQNENGVYPATPNKTFVQNIVVPVNPSETVTVTGAVDSTTDPSADLSPVYDAATKTVSYAEKFVSEKIAYKYDQTVNSPLVIRNDDGTYIIDVYYNRSDFDASVKVTALTTSFYYDGKAHDYPRYTVDYVADGFSVEDVTVEINNKNKSVTNVADSPAPNVKNNLVKQIKLKNNESGVAYTIDVNEDGSVSQSSPFYGKVTVINGRVDVRPRPLEIKVGYAEKKFDGDYFHADQYGKNADKTLGRETITYTVKYLPDEADIDLTLDDVLVNIPKDVITVEQSKISNEEISILGDRLKVLIDNKSVSKDNFIITIKKGDLRITPVDNKWRIKVSINADAEGDGNKKVVVYNGVTQSVITNLKLTVTDREGNEIIYDDSIVPAEDDGRTNIAEYLLSLLQKIRGFMVLTVHASDEWQELPAQTITHDGKNYTVSGLKIKGGEGVDVDTYPVTLNYDDMDITLDGVSVKSSLAENQHGDEIIGSLQVIERNVYLSSESASKVYDGTPLTRPVVAVDVDEANNKYDFVAGEVVDLRADGSITEVGSVENRITYTKVANKYKDRNYIVHTTEGTLTITGTGGDNPPSEPTPPPTEPTPPSVTPPAGQVLGAVREVPSGDGAAVLGARRGRTEDTTNTLGRIITIIVAAGIGFMMIFIKRKKNEE
ncbi:InlB B-repeat-containing protein [Butyrivibrio sp. XPD2006]|uniref:InlB B-repeat-containing protein n=1 Tax=Butyrivibrio sp. XPD2006 TaxID=1280668 RepID=UPI0003B4956E|nr:InlB B-repeat-containing protein [Butyrivibrio sp. XPD2006]